jgi:hypothetical protein
MGRYSDESGKVAGRIGKAAPPPADPDAPKVNPHACFAAGCPLPGSLIIDARRLCFVHFAVRDSMREFDRVTMHLNNRALFLAAVHALRAPGRRSDEEVVREAAQLLPALALNGLTRYRALAAVEFRLQDECTSADDNPIGLDETSHAQAVQAAQQLAQFHRVPT